MAPSFFGDLFIHFLNDESFRESIVDIFKSLCTRPLNVVISLMVLYCVLITFLFSKCAIWKIRYLKDIILWFSFGGTLFVFNSLDDSNEENYIMDYLKDCLSFSVIVGFIFDSFTFNIFIELILMLIIIVLAIFKCVLKNHEESRESYLFIVKVEKVFYLIFTVFTIFKGLREYTVLLKTDTLVGFFIPIVYSFCFAPFVYLLEIYSEYEQFLRLINGCLREYLTKDKTRDIDWQLIKICKLSKPRMVVFKKEYLYRFVDPSGENEVKTIVSEFKEQVQKSK